MHLTPLTTSPTSFDKYANFSIISFCFSFLFSGLITFHFFGGTLSEKWLIYSPMGEGGGLIVSLGRGAVGHTNAYGIIAPLRNAHLYTVNKRKGPHCQNASRWHAVFLHRQESGHAPFYNFNSLHKVKALLLH